MMAEQDDRRETKPIKWYFFLAMGLSGALAGYVTTKLMTGGTDGEPLDVSLSVIAALLVGFILLICLVIVAVGFLFPRAGLAMKMYEDLEQWEDERTMMGLSGLGGGAYALALILLALVEPLGLEGDNRVLAAFGVLVAIFLFSCVRVLREYDELWLGINAESCVVAFYLTMGVGGLWSALAHLEMIPALAPLDWITLLTATSLIGSIWSTWRRGMLKD